MTQTQLFAWLGAPLKNVRWSWGAVRRDGVVFLRVWQDETQKIDGKRCMRLTHHRVFADDVTNSGYQERLEQLEQVRRGATVYMVMCEANPAKLLAREIADFNRDELFLGGAVVEHDGDTWLELKERVNAASVRL